MGKTDYYVREESGLRSITTLRIAELANKTKEKGINLTSQSLSIGMGKDTLMQYMRGPMLPGTDNMRAICLYYGVSADWLLGIEGACDE